MTQANISVLTLGAGSGVGCGGRPNKFAPVAAHMEVADHVLMTPLAQPSPPSTLKRAQS